MNKDTKLFSNIQIKNIEKNLHESKLCITFAELSQNLWSNQPHYIAMQPDAPSECSGLRVGIYCGDNYR